MSLAHSASQILAIILSFSLFILLLSRVTILVYANCPAVIIESLFCHSQSVPVWMINYIRSLPSQLKFCSCHESVPSHSAPVNIWHYPQIKKNDSHHSFLLFPRPVPPMHQDSLPILPPKYIPILSSSFHWNLTFSTPVQAR